MGGTSKTQGTQTSVTESATDIIVAILGKDGRNRFLDISKWWEGVHVLRLFVFVYITLHARSWQLLFLPIIGRFLDRSVFRSKHTGP